MNSKVLRQMGFHEHVIPTAIACCRQAGQAFLPKATMKESLQACLDGRETSPLFQPLAQAMQVAPPCVPDPIPFGVWGEGLDQNTLEQMSQACRVPSARAAALMPDAHLGYGLPIGGVLATQGTVVPYAVGVDIACRMRLSILDMPVEWIDSHREELSKVLMDRTRFGIGSAHEVPLNNPVMDEDWTEVNFVGQLKDKAHKQLGTSGSGNHFVEYGELTLQQPLKGLQPGRYMSILSHSGSRGAGAAICSHYSSLAQGRLPRHYQELGRMAWLDMDSAEGQEYWWAMNLMGRYAAANHLCIHTEIVKALGAQVIASVENHHNFAWKETHYGEELIVHRKGATPAAEGELGIIPGSMATPGFLVAGKGCPESLRSASHGAGRAMSRTAASNKYSFKAVQQDLKKKSVHVLAAGSDEVPYAYKDIHTVMAAQTDLVDVIAQFDPRIVRMSGDGPAED